MLVVTRKQDQKITFPGLGITVHLLRINGATVKVGIDAPPEVRILRDELAPGADETPSLRPDHHALANALSKITLAVHLARKQWDIGRPADADVTLNTALRAVEALEAASRTPAPAPARERFRMLIVEDDANQRELLAGILGMSGCDCATAVDGQDALAYLDAGGRPDVVLLDMAMPRCDGPETLRRIRADGRYTGMRVFSVSSTDPRGVNVPVGPGGFDGWFPKPLNPKRLWDAIQDAARSYAASN